MQMEVSEVRKVRRVWVRPILQAQSTMTMVTQAASPLPMALLFFQTSQCFDAFGNPIAC
jgi:hypothetical protein